MGLYAKDMNIFFDLDGTIIDSKQRLYQLFQFLVPESNFSFYEYWELKMNKISNESILKTYFPNIDILMFHENWMALIESEEYLILDLPFPGTTEYLNGLKQNEAIIYLLTARQSIISVSYQLNRFGWSNMFSDIFVTEQKYEKAEMIKHLVYNHSLNWIVGDTGKDIQTGKILGVNTVAVLTGFLSGDILKTYEPDIIVDNVTLFNPVTYHK